MFKICKYLSQFIPEYSDWLIEYPKSLFAKVTRGDLGWLVVAIGISQLPGIIMAAMTFPQL